MLRFQIAGHAQDTSSVHGMQPIHCMALTLPVQQTPAAYQTHPTCITAS